MPLRNKQYGKATECENEVCDRQRGAPLRSVYHHGCVLCIQCESSYQKGKISLPDAASEARKAKAREKVLG